MERADTGQSPSAPRGVGNQVATHRRSQHRRSQRLTTRRLAIWLGGGVVVLVAAVAAGLSVGSVSLDWSAALEGEGTAASILWNLRLPRVLLAALVGGALATSGAALQSTLRNPLASPEILGVSGGAALAAVSALAFLPAFPLLREVVPLVAFGGALVSSVLVYRLAHVRGRLDPYTQILVGVVFNTFAAACILLVHAVADIGRSHSIVFWLMGGIGSEPYSVLAAAAVLVLPAVVLLSMDARRLNLLAMGDETAARLGSDPDRVRRRVFAASALLVGAVVALCGIITFAGLIVPHVLRRLAGSDNRLLVPLSFLGGAVFLVGCDGLARWIIAPAELPVGALTALAGGPFFIHLLRRAPRAEFGA